MDALHEKWHALERDYLNHMHRLGKDHLVVSAVICAQNKILLVRRSPNDSYPGMWEFPGGGVGHVEGETVVEALRREVLEETGIILPGFPVDEVLVHPTRTALRIILQFDLDEIVPVVLSHEHDQAKFLNVDEAKTHEVDGVMVFETMREENQGVMLLVLENS